MVYFPMYVYLHLSLIFSGGNTLCLYSAGVSVAKEVRGESFPDVSVAKSSR